MKTHLLIMWFLGLFSLVSANNSLSFTGGVNNAGGVGFEYQYLYKGQWGPAIGAGINFDGIRMALGGRYYLPDTSGIYPFLEFMGAYNTGTSKFSTNLDGQALTYRYFKGGNINAGGGFRWDFNSHWAMQWAIGVALPISKDYEIIEGDVSSSKFLNKFKEIGIYVGGNAFLCF